MRSLTSLTPASLLNLIAHAETLIIPFGTTLIFNSASFHLRRNPLACCQ